MDEKISNLYLSLENLLELKIGLHQALESLLQEISTFDGKWDSGVPWESLLEDLKGIVGSVNLDNHLDFIDDIEEALNDIPFKIRKAQNDFKMAVNPILKNTPVFFNEEPPDIQDYFTPTKEY